VFSAQRSPSRLTSAMTTKAIPWLSVAVALFFLFANLVVCMVNTMTSTLHLGRATSVFSAQLSPSRLTSAVTTKTIQWLSAAVALFFLVYKPRALYGYHYDIDTAFGVCHL
jgi:hypothetical protein